VQVGGEERSLVATGASANLDDRVAVVEWIARNDERLELLLEPGDARLQTRLLGPSLLGELGVVNKNELAHLRELVFTLAELGRQLDDGSEAAVFSAELGQTMRLAQRGRISETLLDLGRARQDVREAISERQSRASARLLAELLAEALDAAGSIDQPLLAGEERMALRAHVGVDLRLGRAGLERIAAGALHRRRMVFGMDIGLHDNLDVQDETAAKYTRA
jgi:hypothetical protein